MPASELISRRFKELEASVNQVRLVHSEAGPYVEPGAWDEWATSVLHLLEKVFGADSAHTRHFSTVYEKFSGYPSDLERAKGIFRAAKSDYEGGYLFGLQEVLAGEILADFVMLAKAALEQGNKDVAAVLASAALEDALKRYGRQNGLEVDDKVMQEVVSALKSKGLVAGAHKKILDAMPKLRDYSMHANWEKFTAADVGSLVGFVEQFLLSHFS